MALRLALHNAAMFAVMAAFMPFWPLWLADRGCNGEQIGLLMALWTWTRCFGNPFWGGRVDVSGKRRKAIIGLSWAALASFLLFAWTHSLWSIACGMVLFGLTYPPTIPLSDNLIVTAARNSDVVYGSVRRWGSISFLLVILVAGPIVESGGSERVFTLSVVTLALTALASLGLPQPPADPHAQDAAEPTPLRRLVRERSFVLFLGVCGLVQGSHAAYYAFATKHWHDAGHGEGFIAFLWAEGVIAEVLLFARSAAVLTRFGPRNLMLIGGLAAVVRWTATGLTTDAAALVALNWLHGLSFGATHLGAVHYIATHVAPRRSASAQSLISSVVAAGIAAATMAAAPLFRDGGGDAFFAMALVALAGTGMHFALARQHAANATP